MKYLLLFTMLSITTFAFNQKEKKHLELAELFGEIPQKMTAEELTNLGQTGEKIPVKYLDVLSYTSLSGSYLVPLGKVEQGNKILLFYLDVSGKEAYNPGKVALAYKSIEKKDGEVYMSSHHLLDVGLDGKTQYSGWFEREGKDFIIFHQTSAEPDGTSKTASAKHKFGKYLEFVEHLD